MSENPNASGENQDGSAKPEENQLKDVVAYETHRKLLGEKKRVAEERDQLRAQLDQYNEQQQIDEGKKDEVIQSLREKLNNAESSLKKKDAIYSWSQVEGHIKTAAAKSGCVSPEKLVKLLSSDELNGVQVYDDFTVNQDDVSRLMEKAKSENPFLFEGKTVPVRDLPPGNKVPAPEKKTLNNASVGDLQKAYADLLAKE